MVYVSPVISDNLLLYVSLLLLTFLTKQFTN